MRWPVHRHCNRRFDGTYYGRRDSSHCPCCVIGTRHRCSGHFLLAAAKTRFPAPFWGRLASTDRRTSRHCHGHGETHCGRIPRRSGRWIYAPNSTAPWLNDGAMCLPAYWEQRGWNGRRAGNDNIAVGSGQDRRRGGRRFAGGAAHIRQTPLLADISPGGLVVEWPIHQRSRI